MVLLIPRRIREIKEAGRSEGISEGISEGVSQERGRVSNLRARYERGEITLDEFMSRIGDSGHCDGCGRSG